MNHTKRCPGYYTESRYTSAELPAGVSGGGDDFIYKDEGPAWPDYITAGRQKVKVHAITSEVAKFSSLGIRHQITLYLSPST